MAQKQQMGLIGLAVMGANLARNIERTGFSVAVFNRREAPRKEFADRYAAGKNFIVANSLQDFVDSLERPRRIILMVKAGEAVDEVLSQLRTLLEPGDIVMDGGNSFFRDTERRMRECETVGVQFLGMGVSGGEEGALWGPSIMPGGEESAYREVEPVLCAIAARTEDGPCCTYIGRKGSGHFVKMVHNGIEYGDMQLIAETYDMARRIVGLSTAEIRSLFEDWNRGPLQSFLIETAAKVVDFPDSLTEEPLVDVILDSAGQKGTGKWATQTALDFGVPIPAISAAVDARLLSTVKEERVAAARFYGLETRGSIGDRDQFLEQLRQALYASKICSYAQGFVLLREVSEHEDYGLRLEEIARIWKGGCIIRAVFLDRIREAFTRDPNLPNLLVDPSFRDDLISAHHAWRTVVCAAVDAGVPVPSMSASLAYFDSYRSERLPACLIQAQRDCFGAHTYQRVDRPGVFHTVWE
jgi:6-phosphogluconate dehydrogenase